MTESQLWSAIEALARNDAPGAVALRAEAVSAGVWSKAAAEVVCKTFDEPRLDEYVAAWNARNEAT